MTPPAYVETFIASNLIGKASAARPNVFLSAENSYRLLYECEPASCSCCIAHGGAFGLLTPPNAEWEKEKGDQIVILWFRMAARNCRLWSIIGSRRLPASSGTVSMHGLRKSSSVRHNAISLEAFMHAVIGYKGRRIGSRSSCKDNYPTNMLISSHNHAWITVSLSTSKRVGVAKWWNPCNTQYYSVACNRQASCRL